MKIYRLTIFVILALLSVSVLSGCGTKKRVLVIDCPNEKPAEYNKEGFKKEKERKKILNRTNKIRSKERK